MRLPYLLLSILLVVNLLIDLYIYLALRSYLRNRLWSRIQAWSAGAFALLWLLLLFTPVRSISNTAFLWVMWILFTYASVYISKIIFFVFDVLSRVPLLFKHNRWKWMTGVGTAITVAAFVIMWWGALVNRISLNVEQVIYANKDVPAAFNGFKIAQISDIHLSSFDGDTAFVHRMVERVNSLNPDIIVFTGDMTSRNSTEAEPYIKPLSRLHARYGVYSVFGNHDYGDYETWTSPDAKANDHEHLVSIQKQMGWHLLLDETKQIVCNGDTLNLIGVENISRPPYKTYGSLEKAYPTIGDNKFKVLLSHDPVHWQNDIQDNPNANIALTLSGHTHAMQIELFGASPASAIHKYWSGLYTDKSGKSLYVNIGLGTVGYPARIGSATPEITLITLKRI